MKWLSVSPLLMLLAAAPAYGQWEPPNEVLQIRVSAKGDWAVRCEWQDAKGKTVTSEARKGDRDRLHLSEPRAGICTYRSAPDKPITILLKSPLYRCTLPAREKKMCRQTFAAGSSGQFEIRKRD
ncbi:hypothetical protein IAG41_09710 [Sphingomonas sp. JC676]|uniref:hypothetical protein n=1 Tax=Sphingomonas sp. JC676 TaxID=2768065 RepID=UPI00165782F9|nr:hypothetical protein [Sphingomonas sp. JC676]MBC9032667.1 hypothetical protein [Sphingomonas sp. JC676]